MSDTPTKPKRILTEDHKAKLALARAKANEVRFKNMQERKIEKSLVKDITELEKNKNLNDLKQRKKKLAAVEEEEPEEKPEEKKKKPIVINNIDEDEEPTQIIYKKRPKKIKKKIIYYDESSSDDEHIEYRRRPKEKKVEKAEAVEPKEISSLSDDVIRRQFNTELEAARIQEMVKFFKPETNWRR